MVNSLITQAAQIITNCIEPSIRDIAFIAAIQQIEHHEIAVYGTLRRWAEILNLRDAAVLKSIETDEVRADELLTSISHRVNLQTLA